MNKTFIWDIDGTLFDSYVSIVDSLYSLFHDVLKIDISKDEIYHKCIYGTTGDFIKEMEIKYNLYFEDYSNEYKSIKRKNIDKITLYESAKEIVEFVKSKGGKNFIITHRGDSTFYLLDKFNMRDDFIEVITKNSGFARKPSPDSINYLIDKYKLDRKNTYYVGDRTIDMVAAKNAKIKGVFFLSNKCKLLPNGNEDMVINSLKEIMDI